jgi:hypothetical protein
MQGQGKESPIESFVPNSQSRLCLKIARATIVLVIGGGFDNPQSAQLERWLASTGNARSV